MYNGFAQLLVKLKFSGVVCVERSDLGSPYGRAGCPERGSLRGCRTIEIHLFLTAVPSQSACSADSSPKGRAKGAAAPVRKITIYRRDASS